MVVEIAITSCDSKPDLKPFPLSAILGALMTSPPPITSKQPYLMVANPQHSLIDVSALDSLLGSKGNWAD